MNDIELRDEQPEAPAVAFVDTHTAAPDPHQEARNAAFDATFDWKGQPLGPFTSGRRREWIRLRSIDGIDNSLLDDATKIVWLCLTPTDELIAKRRNPTHHSCNIQRLILQATNRHTLADATKKSSLLQACNQYVACACADVLGIA